MNILKQLKRFYVSKRKHNKEIRGLKEELRHKQKVINELGTTDINTIVDTIYNRDLISYEKYIKSSIPGEQEKEISKLKDVIKNSYLQQGYYSGIKIPFLISGSLRDANKLFSFSGDDFNREAEATKLKFITADVRLSLTK